MCRTYIYTGLFPLSATRRWPQADNMESTIQYKTAPQFIKDFYNQQGTENLQFETHEYMYEVRPWNLNENHETTIENLAVLPLHEWCIMYASSVIELEDSESDEESYFSDDSGYSSD